MIDGMERERAFKQVGAIDLGRRKRQSGLDRFGEWSRREPSDMDGKAREGE